MPLEGWQHPYGACLAAAYPLVQDFLWMWPLHCWRAVRVPGQRAPQSFPLMTFFQPYEYRLILFMPKILGMKRRTSASLLASKLKELASFFPNGATLHFSKMHTQNIPIIQYYHNVFPFDAKTNSINPTKIRFSGIWRITFLSPMTAVDAHELVLYS